MIKNSVYNIEFDNMYKDILKIRNKKILIFGAAGLLGSEYCKYLADQGAIIAAIDIKPFKNKRLKSKNIFYYKCDITKNTNLKKLFKKVIKDLKSIDTVVNCAALDAKFDNKSKISKYSNIYNYPEKFWNNSFKINLTGALNIAKIFGKYFESKKNGNLIFIGSNYGVVAPDQSIYNTSSNYKIFKPADYVVTKFGLVGLMKYLASYYRFKNIRVNMISPTGIDDTKNKKHSKKFKKKFSQNTLLNRMSNIDEFNGALHYLCSDSSSYMTGSNIIIDGGWTVT